MQRRLIFTAAGAFGFGALVSWAVTADILEKRFKEERAGYDQLLGDKTRHIWALQDRLDNPTGIAGWSRPTNITVSDVDPNQEVLIEVSTSNAALSNVEFVNNVEEAEEEEVSEIPEGETPEETKTNLQKLIDAYTANQDASDEFTNIMSGSIEVDKSPPFVIPRAVYTWDEEGEHYEKVTLTYFPRDRVLLDEDEDPIEDVAGFVGWRSLSQFGGESEDPDVVFVRNRRLETDFEVVKEDSAQLPLHVKYGMEKEEFRANKAAGLIKLRQEDDDN